MRVDICKNCQKQISQSQRVFCSNQCQSDYQFKRYIIEWKRGNVSGLRGKNTYNFSAHVIRYLLDKYSNACALCGWNRVNVITKRSPLEIDHIDGNWSNNTESNLIVLCPNCHSLTPSYKNLNKGSGRIWRRDKCVKII